MKTKNVVFNECPESGYNAAQRQNYIGI